MKKVLKQIIRIFLALVLAYILFSVGAKIYCEIEFRKVTNARPPKTTEESIADFNANKEKFEVIKDYIIAEEDEQLYLTTKNYEQKVHDENIKSDLEFIFTQLKYSIVEQYSDSCVCFKYDRKDLAESGVVYSKNQEPGGLFQCSELGENWYNFFLGYTYDINPIEKFAVEFRWIVYIILSIGLYLLLGKIPPFRKRKCLDN